MTARVHAFFKDAPKHTLQVLIKPRRASPCVKKFSNRKPTVTVTITSMLFSRSATTVGLLVAMYQDKGDKEGGFSILKQHNKSSKTMHITTIVDLIAGSVVCILVTVKKIETVVEEK